MPKSCIKNKIISSSSSWDIFNESVNGRTNGRTKWLQYNPLSTSGGIMRNKCVSHNVTIIGLTICFFMLHNPYKSKKWYLSMHRLARSLTNQSCGPLLIWNGPLQIWNGTLFSTMAPWCDQVRGHSLFDKNSSQSLVYQFQRRRFKCDLLSKYV
jgi:hypothetical protein